MKITKEQLKQIIKEELESVLSEYGDISHDLSAERPRRPQDATQQAAEVYELHWKEAVRKVMESPWPWAPIQDEEYDDYNPKSKDPEARSNVGYALNHLQILLGKNPSPSMQEIIKAISDGWEESSYEFQYQQEQEYEDEDY